MKKRAVVLASLLSLSVFAAENHLISKKTPSLTSTSKTVDGKRAINTLKKEKRKATKRKQTENGAKKHRHRVAKKESAAQQAFINKLVQTQHFDRAQLTALFTTLHCNTQVVSHISAPFEKKPWSYYRSFFVTERRVRLGAEYLDKHRNELLAMQKAYGVPPSIIAAIIGVETEYGNHLGNYPVLDALYTLGFCYQPRSAFFKKELEAYLVLTRKNKLPPKLLKGSYAGAFGIPQFMPSSYHHYAVSASNKGNINLYHHGDAIASVANYFQKMGWKANEPVVKKLSWRLSLLPAHTERLTLPMPDGNEYWATYPNFKVIMRYNHNVVYAMAVTQLSQAIETRYEKTSTKG